MTVQSMIAALPALQKLMELKLPIKKAHAIYNLAKTINEQREFFINEEKKIIEKFNVQIDGGNLRFESPQAQEEFVREHADLMQYEVEGLRAIELSFSDLEGVELTPVELGTLDGVIIFVE